MLMMHKVKNSYRIAHEVESEFVFKMCVHSVVYVYLK